MRYSFHQLSHHFQKRSFVKKIFKLNDSNPEVSNNMKAFTLQMTPKQNLEKFCQTAGLKGEFPRKFLRHSTDSETRNFSFEHLGSGSAGSFNKKKRHSKFAFRSDKYLKLKETMDTERR